MKNMTIVSGTTARESLWEYSYTSECDISYAYIGSKSYFLSFLRIVWEKLKIPFVNIWYNREVINYKGTLIIFEADISMHYLQWLMLNSKAERLIVYYWNTYRKGSIHPDKVREIGYEMWSFDQDDCLKYDMKYNPQMFFPSWYEGIEENKRKKIYDIVFVGRDQFGRMHQMQKTIDLFKEKNINYYLYFVARKWYQRFCSPYYSRYLDFQDMIKEELKGRAVLDFYLSSQSGFTIRIYDALCNNRKVVTNNSRIKQLDFYSRENIFILGEDNENLLNDFIQSDFQPIDSAILQRYSIKGWLERFEKTR